MSRRIVYKPGRAAKYAPPPTDTRNAMTSRQPHAPHGRRTTPENPVGGRSGLDHGPACRRRAAPILRASWNAGAELWCPECGRYAPAGADAAGWDS